MDSGTWQAAIAGGLGGAGLIAAVVGMWGDSFIVRKLNGRYLKTEVAKVHFDSIQQRFSGVDTCLVRIEEKLDRLIERT